MAVNLRKQEPAVIYRDAAELNIPVGTRPHEIIISETRFAIHRGMTSPRIWIYFSAIGQKLVVFND